MKRSNIVHQLSARERGGPRLTAGRVSQNKEKLFAYHKGKVGNLISRQRAQRSAVAAEHAHYHQLINDANVQVDRAIQNSAPVVTIYYWWSAVREAMNQRRVRQQRLQRLDQQIGLSENIYSQLEEGLEDWRTRLSNYYKAMDETTVRHYRKRKREEASSMNAQMVADTISS